jgi:hypothetical protein
MRKILFVIILCLLASPVYADKLNPQTGKRDFCANFLEVDGDPHIVCPRRVVVTNGSLSGTVAEVSLDVSGVGSGAPTDATYITQTPDGTLSAEQALSNLSDGLLKHDDGVVALATEGTDYTTTSSNTVFVNKSVDVNGGNIVRIGAGATAAPNTSGDVSIDTTNAQVQYFDSSVHVLDPRKSFSFVLESPSTQEGWTLYKSQWPHTITDIHCIAEPGGASDSAIIMITECSSAGASCASVDTTVITCDNDGAEDDGSLSNGAIDAADWVSVDIGLVSGSPRQLTVTGYFTVDQT